MRLLSRIPLASVIFLVFAITGAAMLVLGSMQYGSYSDNLMAVGIACGAIGVPRAIAKVSAGDQSINLLGFIESAPVVSSVFLLFLLVSAYSLGIGAIEVGAFSDNLLKVGVACGAVGAARITESAGLPDELPE